MVRHACTYLAQSSMTPERQKGLPPSPNATLLSYYLAFINRRLISAALSFLSSISLSRSSPLSPTSPACSSRPSVTIFNRKFWFIPLGSSFTLFHGGYGDMDKLKTLRHFETIYPLSFPAMSAVLLRHVVCQPSLFLRHSLFSSYSSLDQLKLQSTANFSSFCAVRASPFTEKHSIERYQRDAWLYQQPIPQGSLSLHCDSDSIREDDIALQLPELKKLLEELKQRRSDAAGGADGRGPGNVFLVGTGPGDPELLTVKAMNAIQSADLVLYDRLVSNDIMDLVSSDARLLYVGKTAGYHSRTQEEIHELLLSFAEAGANVVRLKGGDPLVFGRGGEEMDFLQRQGIHVKVIPGITAASGIAAELGIPLTHRGIANSVQFLTGHSRKGGTDPLFVADHAADPDSTLVVYMGLSTLPSTAMKLISNDLDPSTPSAAIERGTTPHQRTVFAELQNLVDEVKAADLVSPTLIIIGKVVALSPYWPFCSIEQPILADQQNQAPGLC